MALQHVIKDVVDKFGVDVIRDDRFVNILNDMGAFTGSPATKRVLGELLKLGYGEKLYALYEDKDPSWDVKIKSYTHNIVNMYGYSEPIVSQLLNAISWALKPNILVDVSTQTTGDEVEPDMLTNISTKSTKEEWESRITDEDGVSYSQDGLKLLSVPSDYEGGPYEIMEGTIVICNMVCRGCESLKSIVIPASVMSIGGGAFAGCNCKITCNSPHFKVHNDALFTADMRTLIYCPTSKRRFVIPNGVTSIGDSAFDGCGSLIIIKIPSSVTQIDDRAFDWCRSLTTITIPDGVTTIGEDAFNRCESLKSIEIPSSVTSIGDGAFAQCKCKITCNSPYFKVHDDVLFTADMRTLLYCPTSKTSFVVPDSVTSIGDSAFAGCESLVNIKLPSGLTRIGDCAFNWCKSLASIAIPDGVTSIGNFMFSQCESLTSITIPDGVTSIGDWTFDGCNSLKSIVIPASVTHIGAHAFLFCRSLKSVVITGRETTIDPEAFEECGLLKKIYIPIGTYDKFAKMLPKHRVRLVEKGKSPQKEPKKKGFWSKIQGFFEN